MTVVQLPEHLFGEAIGLWHDCGLTRPWNDPLEDLERAVRGPASTVLASLRGGRLLGTAIVGHDGHRGWVYYLAVHEGSRRSGVGRSLMEACEQWTAAQGMPKLQLMVRTGNEPVLEFYERLGYERNEVMVLGRRLG